jgi:prephenate dehydrogenase
MCGVRAVCVLGIGLIGGSLLRAAVSAGRPAWGASASDEDVAAATAAGFDIESSVSRALRRAAAEDAVVVLAVPLPAVKDVLTRVAEHAPQIRLTDVVSVKQPVVDAVHQIAPQARYIGGHPMAGNSRSGWEAGSADLFSGAPWVLNTTAKLDPENWLETARLALDCGAHIVPADPTDHDEAVARISHLPHMLAAVLAAVGADGGPLALSLAAGSFTDGTRVAGSDPELVRAMCEGNRTALLPAMDDALGRLGAARGSLASTGGLRATLRMGNEGRRAFELARDSPRTTVRIDVDAAEAASALLGVGERGGRVVALDDRTAVAEVPDPVS